MKNENGLEYGCNRLEAQTPKEGIQMNDNTTVPQTNDIDEVIALLRSTMHMMEAALGNQGAAEMCTPVQAFAADEYDEPRRNGTISDYPRDIGPRQAAWLKTNDGLVTSVQPDWADSDLTEVDFEFPEEADSKAEAVMFNRKVGTVAIEQAFLFDDEGGLYPPSEPQLWEEEDGHAMAIGRASVVGTDLIKAAQIMNGPGEVTASMFEIVGNALGISGTDLYALAHVAKDPETDITVSELLRTSRYVGMSPTELYNLAHPAAPDVFDVVAAEEEAHLGRDIYTGQPFTIVLDHESQGGLSRDGARALARRLDALADDWDREATRTALRRLPNVDDELRERDV